MHDLSYAHQECEKFANLGWMLGWIAYEFETLKQMETMQEKRPGWKEINPSQSRNLGQVFELIPKNHIDEQEACMLVQSGKETIHVMIF